MWDPLPGTGWTRYRPEGQPSVRRPPHRSHPSPQQEHAYVRTRDKAEDSLQEKTQCLNRFKADRLPGGGRGVHGEGQLVTERLAVVKNLRIDIFSRVTDVTLVAATSFSMSPGSRRAGSIHARKAEQAEGARLGWLNGARRGAAVAGGRAVARDAYAS